MTILSNNQTVVRAITNSVRAMLSQDAGCAAHGSALSGQSFMPVFAFAAALNDNTPVPRLMQLFEKIKNPGFTIIHNFILHLLKEPGQAPKHVQAETIRTQSHQYAQEIQGLLSLIDLETLVPAQKIIYAGILAELGRLDEAQSVIARAYEQDETLTDAYAAIGWRIYWPSKQYNKVIEWIEKELTAARLSPGWKLSLAQVYAADNRIELSPPLIEEAYKLDPELSDGYARCAWQHFWQKRDYEKTIQWIKKDLDKDRLSQACKLNLAQAYAAADRFDDAVALVEKAYETDPSLTDGYARCAWQHFWQKKEYDKVIKWLEKDLAGSLRSPLHATRSPRLSAPWQLNLAQAYAATDRFDDAVALVEKAYETDPSLTDGYARCVWLHFWPQREYEKAIHWMKKDLDKDRLSPSWKLNLAHAYSAIGNFDEALPLVEAAYAESPDMKDGYARCAWQYFWPKKEYAKVIEWLEKDLALSTPRSTSSAPCSPLPAPRSSRLSPLWLLNYAKAVALTKSMEDALPLIESACADNPRLENPYTQVAWTRFIPGEMAYEKVLPYMERDLQSGRLTGDWLLNYAQTLAIVGQESQAEKQVQEAYKADSTLVNGYARCAFFNHFLFNYEPARALSGFEQDQMLGRLQGMLRIHYAGLLAVTGRFAAALDIVAKTYTEDATAGNGYALAGWYYYAVHCRTPEKALEFFERDEKMGRLHPNGMLLLAGLYALVNDRQQATQIVQNAYCKDDNIFGGYVIVGFCDYANKRDLRYLRSMIEKDKQRNIDAQHLNYLYGAVLRKDGEIQQSKLLINHVAQRSALAANYAKSWLIRIGCADKQLISELITSEFKQLRQI